jgi:endonuclease/exonuclease/phosphatase (EEP) superfamily protein YafD
MKNKLTMILTFFVRVFRRSLRIIIWCAFAFVVLASIAGFFSDCCTPCELLSHFRVAYVIAFSLFGIGFALAKNKRAAIAASALLIVNLVPIATLYVPATPGAVSQESENMRILQFNLQGGKNKEYEKTISLITKIDPDVVGLSELTGTWVTVLEERLSAYPYRVVYPHAGGVSIFSKYPLTNARVKHFGKISRPRITAQIDFKGKPVDVVFVHTVTPLKSRSLRNGELSVVAREAKQFKNPGIVFGDMNITPWSASFERLLVNGGLQDSERGFGFMPTWSAKMMVSLLTIDHLLTTPHFWVRDRKVLRSVGSDHYPVLVELALKKV